MGTTSTTAPWTTGRVPRCCWMWRVRFKADPASQKRSVLFVFVSGEEKGLLGSRYFAAHPTVPAKSIVADINTDMFLPLIPLKMLTVLRTRGIRSRR